MEEDEDGEEEYDDGECEEYTGERPGQQQLTPLKLSVEEAEKQQRLDAHFVLPCFNTINIFRSSSSSFPPCFVSFSLSRLDEGRSVLSRLQSSLEEEDKEKKETVGEEMMKEAQCPHNKVGEKKRKVVVMMMMILMSVFVVTSLCYSFLFLGALCVCAEAQSLISQLRNTRQFART